MESRILNHHSATLLPYFVGPDGKLTFLFEQKGADYKPPIFDSALNLLGGNWSKGKNVEQTPREIVTRELQQEFFLIGEPEEDLNALLGQKFLNPQGEGYDSVANQTPNEVIRRAKSIGNILQSDPLHSLDAIMRVSPPVTKGQLIYGSSIFTKQLQPIEVEEITDAIKSYDGRLTTDNLRFGGRLVLTTLDFINQRNSKFSWGYDKVLNLLLEGGHLPRQPYGVLRTLEPIQLEPLGELHHSFADFESEGFQYRLSE